MQNTKLIKEITNKQAGDTGELEVIELVPCPNCGKKLMILPTNYPLFDAQCTSCSFRAQIKTNQSKPKKKSLMLGGKLWKKY